MGKLEHGRPSVSTDRFATAVLKEDSGKNLEYDAVKEIESDLITIKYTPKMNAASMYASGINVESYIAKAGGTVDITVVGLTDEEEKDYFGARVGDDGVVTENKDDYVNDVAVIWSTIRSDGKMNLYKIMKTKSSSQGEEATTSDDNGVTFNGTALQGDYKALIHSGDILFKKKKVNPKTAEGKELIEAWFSTALGGITLTKDEEADEPSASGEDVSP
ncbi:MAG: phage tail protein [Roseburia sp.]|nr:phage tail protein [Roseburia sp.]